MKAPVLKPGERPGPRFCQRRGSDGSYCQAPAVWVVMQTSYCEACEAKFRDDFENDRNFLGIYATAKGLPYPKKVPLKKP